MGSVNSNILEFIGEGRDAPLYYYTDLQSSTKIVKSNYIKNAQKANVGSDDGVLRPFISFSRSKHGAPDVSKEIRFTLNQRKLSHKYKIVPRADINYRDRVRNNEQEEVIFTDRVDLKTYCMEVDFFDYPDYILQFVEQAIKELETTKGLPQRGFGGSYRPTYFEEINFLHVVLKSGLPIGKKLKHYCDLYKKHSRYVKGVYGKI